MRKTWWGGGHKPEGGVTEDHPIREHKAALIQRAYIRRPFRSFADLGGCWGVHGGYAVYARELCGDAFDRGYILDQLITPLTVEKIVKWDDLIPIQTLLGSKEARKAVGRVDALIMFDILLHQANPPWDRFIKDWVPQARTVVVYNQNWFKDKKSQRFIENGLDWYLSNVYYNNNTEGLKNWFANHAKFNEAQGVPERDIHNWWQWGITQSDLLKTFTASGFDLVYLDTFHEWSGYPWIIDQGLIFERSAFR